jgi:hypothetical protein
MGHFGVPVGVYGQQVSIIKGVNIGERVWTKAQRSCANARTASTSITALTLRSFFSIVISLSVI